MKKGALTAKVICLCFALFLLIVLEGASRVVFREDMLDRILYILKEDPVLFWRQKRNLHVRFQGTQLHTDSLGLRNKRSNYSKDAQSFRIVCLGASPTFGWGIEHEFTYPYQLERLFEKRVEKRIQVINAGVIGYSSYQGLIFLKEEIERLNPDLITVSYVLNDLDKYRFYRSNGKQDKELAPGDAFLLVVRNILNRSRFFRILMKFSAKKGPFLSDEKDPYYPGDLRVSPEDYRINLQSIVNFAKDRGIKVVFIKMPVNLPVADKISEVSRNKSDGFLVLGKECMRFGEYDKAIEFLNKAVEYNPYSSQTFYLLAVCSKKNGRRSEMLEYLKKAKKAEAYRCGTDGLIYNKIMEGVAVRNGICLVDIVSAFKEKKDEYLFIHPDHDPIHPNVAGHRIISHKLYQALIQRGLLSEQ